VNKHLASLLCNRGQYTYVLFIFYFFELVCLLGLPTFLSSVLFLRQMNVLPFPFTVPFFTPELFTLGVTDLYFECISSRLCFSLSSTDVGFILVIDRRQDRWAAVKGTLLRIAVSLSLCLQAWRCGYIVSEVYVNVCEVERQPVNQLWSDRYWQALNFQPQRMGGKGSLGNGEPLQACTSRVWSVCACRCSY